MTTAAPPKKGGILTYDLYKLFQQYIRNGCTCMPDINLLHDLVDGPVTTSAKRKRLRKKFKSWAARMDARESDGRLVYKSTGKLIVPEEYFIPAIKKKHCGSNNNKHLNLTQTIEAVMEEYSVGKREFGIDKDLIVVVVNSCPDPQCQRAAQHRHNHKVSQNGSGPNSQPLQYKYLYHVQDQRIPNFPNYPHSEFSGIEKDDAQNSTSTKLFDQIPSYLQDITATDKITKQIKNCSSGESNSFSVPSSISHIARNSLTKEQNFPHYSLASSTNVSWSTQASNWSHYCIHHNTMQEGNSASPSRPSPHLPSSIKTLHSSCSGGSVQYDMNTAVPAQGFIDSFIPGTIPSSDSTKEDNTAVKTSLKALLGSHALSGCDSIKSSNSIPNNLLEKLSSNFSRFPRIQPKPMTYSLAPASNTLHFNQHGNPYFNTSGPIQFSPSPSSGAVNFNTLPTAINSSSTIAKILEISKGTSTAKNVSLTPVSSAFPSSSFSFSSATSSSNTSNDSSINFKIPNAVQNQDKLDKFRIPMSPSTVRKPGSSPLNSKSDCHSIANHQKCCSAYKKNFHPSSPNDLQKRNNLRALKQNHHKLRKNLKSNFLRRHMGGGRGHINDSLSLIHTLRSEIPCLESSEEENVESGLIRLVRHHPKSCDCC